MITIFAYLKFLIRVIIGIVLLPFWVMYIIIKYLIFRYTFNKNLQKQGVDKITARLLSKELNMLLPHNYKKWGTSPEK